MIVAMLPACREPAAPTRDWYSDSSAMTSPGASRCVSGVNPRRSTIRIAARRSSAWPGSSVMSLARMRPATSGAKKRDSSLAAI